MADEKTVWRNGEMIPWSQATVHLLSHGFSRGSAIFEFFGVHDTPRGPMIFRMDDHFRRFDNTANLLGMEPAQSPDEIKEAVIETVRANGVTNGYVKVMAYWSGEALAELVPDEKLDMTIFAVPAGAGLGLPSEAISACFSKWRKLHPRTVPVEAKVAAHYLNSMLARQEARRRGFDMGLMLDTHGYVAEGSIEAFFMVKDSVLKTPPLGRVLASVSRQSVIDVARANDIEVLETPLLPEEFEAADEIFASATPFKTLPVGRFEDRTLADAPGKITRRLAELFEKILSGGDERFNGWFTPV